MKAMRVSAGICMQQNRAFDFVWKKCVGHKYYPALYAVAPAALSVIESPSCRLQGIKRQSATPTHSF
jgi:hypothetical protein